MNLHKQKKRSTMEIDIGRLEELNGVQERLNDLRAMEDMLSRPALTDVGTMREAYRAFRESASGDGGNRYMVRKQFIFIAVWLYSPGSLAGAKLRPGVRRELASVLGLRSPRIVSNELSDLMFYYCTYPDFRSAVDRRLRDVAAALGLD